MVGAAVLYCQVTAVNQRGAGSRSYGFAVEFQRDIFTGGNCHGASQTEILRERDCIAGTGGGNRVGERSISYAANFADRLGNFAGVYVQGFTGGALQRDGTRANLNDNVRAAGNGREGFSRNFERVIRAEIVNHVGAVAFGVAENIRAAAGINHVVSRAAGNGIARAGQAYRVIASAGINQRVRAAAGNRIAAGRRIVRHDCNVAAHAGNIPRALVVEVGDDLFNGAVERVGFAGRRADRNAGVFTVERNYAGSREVGGLAGNVINPVGAQLDAGGKFIAGKNRRVGRIRGGFSKPAQENVACHVGIRAAAALERSRLVGIYNVGAEVIVEPRVGIVVDGIIHERDN